MKKILLLGAAAMAAVGVMAQEAETPVNYTTQPSVLPGAVLTHLSSNGLWAVSEQYGSIVIANLVEGIFDTFLPDDGNLYYTTGSGNAIADNGIVVGTEFASGSPMYCEDGEWIILPYKDTDENLTETVSNGITPDASMIVGAVGRKPMDLDSDAQMAYPAFWQRNDKGMYDMYVDLPAPTVDLMGKVPQRVNAICVSDNGKVIAGQIVDWSGMMLQPIIYVQDDKGEWSYKLPCDKLYHPDIELPADPGDSPAMPQFQDYMTEERYEAYQEAVNEYFQGIIAEYPDPTDYMTDEKVEEYEAAMAEYSVEFEKWNDELMTYYIALEEYQNAMPLLAYNIIYLSPDGRYLAASVEKGDFFNPEYHPVIFDLEKDVMYTSEDIEGAISYINDSGLVMGSTSGAARMAWVSDDMLKTATPLQDYAKAKNEAIYDFMNANMRHDYETMDYETWESTLVQDAWITGVPVASTDMSIIATWVDNVWDFSDEAPYSYSYILPMSYVAGINNVVATTANLSVAGEGRGIVAINGEANRLEVYDAQGRLVFRQDTPESRVDTNLPTGIYLLKVYNAQGNTASAKAAL